MRGTRTSFVGRRDETAEARRLLGSTRLLTLTGAGGVGKTRLSHRLASDVAGTFPDGVHLVELAGLRDPDLLTAAVGEALGVHDLAESSSAALLDYLKARRLLLVLDNCEHLVEGAAELVHTILVAAPRVTVLATSRQSLGVSGEQVYVVPPLGLPDNDVPAGKVREYDAVGLFLDRATAIEPSLELDDEQLRDIARLCRHLDGLPLAIELAAARVRALSPKQIAERLDHGLALLAGGSRLAPERQQTMRAAIDGSLELCTDLERTVWARAAVFAGSFDLEAAEYVCQADDLPAADVLAALDGLVDKSILSREHTGATIRFWFLEPIREYGHDLLDSSGFADAVARRHRDRYDELTVQAEATWFSPTAFAGRLGIDSANLRAALSWSIASSGEPERSLALAMRLQELLTTRGFPREARRWVERALAICPADVPGRARAMATSAWAAVFHADPDGALALAAEAEALEDPEAVPDIAHVRAFARMLNLQPAAALARAAVDEHLARQDLRRAMHPMFVLGIAQAIEGDPEVGRATLARMVEICEPMGDTPYLAMARFGQAVLEVWFFEDPEAAVGPAREAVRLSAAAGSVLGLAHHVDGLAWVAACRKDHVRAATLFGATSRMWEACGSRPEVVLFVSHQRFVEETRTALGDEAFALHHARGLSLTLDEAVAYALEQETPQADPSATPLSRREQEIALLVAAGLTNKQIAERLVISVRTADSHVRNILMKLGLKNRTQVAGWVSVR